jgi:hypothetical protein
MDGLELPRRHLSQFLFKLPKIVPAIDVDGNAIEIFRVVPAH